MDKLKSTYPIGIDFENQDIYAVQFKKTGDGIAVREMVHRRLSHPLEDVIESGDSLALTLKKMIKMSRFRGKRVNFNIPSQYVQTFPISFELSNGRSIEEAIAQELKGYVSLTAEELTIDYPSVMTVSNGETTTYKAIAVVVQRDNIEKYLGVLKRAGLSVEAVDSGLSSLTRLHRNLFGLSKEPVILCNIGQLQSMLCVIDKDHILAYRNMQWGIQPLLNILQNNLELQNDVHALSLLAKYGLFYEGYPKRPNGNGAEDLTDRGHDQALYRVLFQLLSPHIDELINEFRQIIGYLRAENHQISFKDIFMYGQANRIFHLDKHLERRLDISTKCINPLTGGLSSEDSILSEKLEDSPFTLALGLAMREMTWL